MKAKVYSKNLKVLRRTSQVLAKLVEGYTKPLSEYEVQLAKNNSPTLAKKVDGKTFQIHSKYNPEREATQQIEGSGLVNPKILVFCGLGFAYHIKAALEKFRNDIAYIFIIEKDVAAFRMAVENVDLSDLFMDTRIHWMVGVERDDAYKFSYQLFSTLGLSIQLYLKTISLFSHPVISGMDAAYYTEMMKQLREAGYMTIFNYGNSSDDSLIGLANILDNLNLIMRNPGIKDLYGVFKGKPGIVVSTGPSLNKNIKLLSEAMGKAVIVAADASLKPMYNNNLKPDMTVSLERITLTGRIYEELDEDYKKDIYLAATPVIMNMAYEQWNGPKIMVYRDFAHFKWLDMDKGTLPIGASCSNQAFQILKAMGCDPIILVGQDCAFESIEKTHADGTSSVTKLSLQENELYKVKGNYQDWVYTNDIYDIFRKTFVSDIANYNGKCINATEGGAYIEGSHLMTLREALDQYCKEDIDVKGICEANLKKPTESEITSTWIRFKRTLQETIREVEDIVAVCDRGDDMIRTFEQRLADENIHEIPEFLEKFPDEDLDNIIVELNRLRLKIIKSGKYFNLYLMHILQMIIIHFEIELNSLPSMSQDKKRCKLQSIRLMKSWFPQIRDVSRRSLEYIKTDKANMYRNVQVFEEFVLENKELYDVSWERYQDYLKAGNKTKADVNSLLYYCAREQEDMAKEDFYKTKKDLARHQARLEDIKKVLLEHFEIEI